MTISLGNRAKMSTSTTGTGTITLGNAVSGFQTFADAGITNGQTVRYAIDDGANFEIGSGTYTSSGTTLTRSVTESSNSDSAISLSGSAEVFIAATVADLNPLYIANPSSATNPTAAGTNAVSIGSGSVASGEKGFALLGGTASGQYAMAFNNYAVASAEKSISLGWLTDATATSAVAIGTGTQSSGSHSVSLGQANASGADSFAAAINNSTSSYGATGANSIAMGNHNKSTGTQSISLGGYNNVSSGNSSFVTGYQALASGAYGVAAGFQAQATEPSTVALGYQAEASAIYSIAIGNNAKSAVSRQIAFSAGRFAALGDAQGSIFILRSDTTDATAEAMTTNNSTAAADNQIVAASDTCIMFSGTIVAMQNGAADQGGWEIKGLLKNDGGTTTLVSSNIQTFAEGNGWAVALSADNTNNALKVQVTGEASHNIRWVANIQTSEVTYA